MTDVLSTHTPTAVVGLGFEIGVAASGIIGNPSIPFYSLFIVLWGVFMLGKCMYSVSRI